MALKKTRPKRSPRRRQAAPDAKWTVMVFMSAEQIAGDVPLRDAALADLAEMAVVGSSDVLNLFVQVHGLDAEPRRAKITEGMTWERIVADPDTVVPANLQETRDGTALDAFMRDAFNKAEHDVRNPAHYSMLVLWGHAYDFGVARTLTESGTPDALDFAELSRVLDHIQSRLQSDFELPEPPRLDVVAFDACDASTVELAYELSPFAKFLLSSQVGIPIPGWPYDRVLRQLLLPRGRVMSPPEFGVWAVRRFIEAYSPSRSISLSMLNLDKIAPVVARVKVLSELMLSVISDDPAAEQYIADLLSRSLTLVDRPYIDLADLCVNLARESGDEAITEASRALGDVLMAAQYPIVDMRAPIAGRRDQPDAYPFVVAHGRNAGDTARLNGGSVYAPHRTADDRIRNARQTYESMKFSRLTQWSEVVHRLAPLV